MEEKAYTTDNYIEQMHKFGRRSIIMALIMMFAFPVLMAVYFQMPDSFSDFFSGSFDWGAFFSSLFDWRVFFSGLLSVSMIYLPVCIGEVIMYSPVLGTGSTYLTFITGNISNLKLPCIMNSMSITETEEGTEEAEVIATLASASSSCMTALVMIVGVILMIPLTPVLSNEILSPAFENLLPVLFGAIGVTYLAKSVRLGIVPIVCSVVIY
ncbi:MAG: hypothetical protein LIO46_04765, partial [Clostridiales bacterium]|nr:hypothetical protein [Clostridiales bacterium]